MSGTPAETGRGILILDMSYTLEMFRRRQLDQALESRKLGGYFATVISVHPLAALFASGRERFGAAAVTRLDASHVFIEGRLGITRWLAVLPPLNFLLAQVSLVRLLVRMSRSARISLVRIGDPYYLGILGWILARWLDVPLAIRVPFRYDEIRRLTGRATMPRLFRYGWIEKCIERFIFPRCDLIAGANEDNMRYALENGGRPETATVFRYGNLLHPAHWVEPALRESGDAELGEIGLRGKRFIATVSRLERTKRVDDAVRVLAELVRNGHDVHALMPGDGSMRDELAELARSLDVADRLVLAGNRTQEWLARVLPHASVIVSPHMGRALVEAALAGVPMVAYDYDWQREVAIDSETGYLVPNGDWRRMAECTGTLLRSSEEARRMGENARRTLARMMDPEALMRHEQRTYSALLERWAAAQLSRSADRNRASSHG